VILHGQVDAPGAAPAWGPAKSWPRHSLPWDQDALLLALRLRDGEIALHHLLDELDDARPRLRATLPAPEDKHLNCVGWPEARHQGDRRRHLARQLHAL